MCFFLSLTPLGGIYTQGIMCIEVEVTTVLHARMTANIHVCLCISSNGYCVLVNVTQFDSFRYVTNPRFIVVSPNDLDLVLGRGNDRGRCSARLNDSECRWAR